MVIADSARIASFITFVVLVVNLTLLLSASQVKDIPSSRLKEIAARKQANKLFVVVVHITGRYKYTKQLLSLEACISKEWPPISEELQRIVTPLKAVLIGRSPRQGILQVSFCRAFSSDLGWG